MQSSVHPDEVQSIMALATFIDDISIVAILGTVSRVDEKLTRFHAEIVNQVERVISSSFDVNNRPSYRIQTPKLCFKTVNTLDD